MRSRKTFKSIASFVMVMAMVAPMAVVPGKTADAAAKLSSKSASLTVGATKSVTVKGAAKKSKFTWKSSNTKVASVAGKAKKATIKGVGAGTAKVTCTVKKGKKKSTLKCTVKVSQVVSSVAVDKTSLSIKPGDKPILTVKVNNGAAGATTNQKITWSSSNSKVAKVVKSGTSTAKVTGLSNGSATITVKVGTKTATCSVKVDGSVKSNSSSSTTNNNDNKGNTTTSKATATPKPKATQWKYDDPNIIYKQHFDVTRWYDPDNTGKAANGNGHKHDGYKNNSFAVWMVGFYDNKYSTNESEYNEGIYGPGLKNYKGKELAVSGEFKYDGQDRKTILLQINYTSPADYPIMWKWEKGATKVPNKEAQGLKIEGGASEEAKAGEWHNVNIPKFIIPSDAKNGDTDPSTGEAYDFYLYFPNKPGGELQYTKDNTFHFRNFKITQKK